MSFEKLFHDPVENPGEEERAEPEHIEDAPDAEAEYARRLREAAEGPFDLTFGEPFEGDGEKPLS